MSDVSMTSPHLSELSHIVGQRDAFFTAPSFGLDPTINPVALGSTWTQFAALANMTTCAYLVVKVKNTDGTFTLCRIPLLTNS